MGCKGSIKIMNKRFKKPKYKIYAGMLLLFVFLFLHATLTPDVRAKDLGNAKKGERIACEGFDFSAQMAPDSSGNVQGMANISCGRIAEIIFRRLPS